MVLNILNLVFIFVSNISSPNGIAKQDRHLHAICKKLIGPHCKLQIAKDSRKYTYIFGDFVRFACCCTIYLCILQQQNCFKPSQSQNGPLDLIFEHSRSILYYKPKVYLFELVSRLQNCMQNPQTACNAGHVMQLLTINPGKNGPLGAPMQNGLKKGVSLQYLLSS